MTTYSFGSSPSDNDGGYNSYFGSDEEYGSNIDGWPWCKNLCDNDKPCSPVNVCESTECPYPFKMFSYKKSRVMNAKEIVCVGQERYAPCWHYSEDGTYVQDKSGGFLSG